MGGFRLLGQTGARQAQLQSGHSLVLRLDHLQVRVTECHVVTDRGYASELADLVPTRWRARPNAVFEGLYQIWTLNG